MYHFWKVKKCSEFSSGLKFLDIFKDFVSSTDMFNVSIGAKHPEIQR